MRRAYEYRVVETTQWQDDPTKEDDPTKGWRHGYEGTDGHKAMASLRHLRDDYSAVDRTFALLRREVKPWEVYK